MPNRIDPTTSHSKVWVVITLNVEITVGLMKNRLRLLSLWVWSTSSYGSAWILFFRENSSIRRLKDLCTMLLDISTLSIRNWIHLMFSFLGSPVAN